MSEFISLSEPWLTKRETDHVLEAIESGWLTQSGSAVKQMESTLLSSVTGTKFIEAVTSCSNGTTALHLALLSIGVTQGDEVIVPNFSYIAVINSVIYCGATPVVVDVNLENWCLSTDAVKKAITSKTKAIIAVDNYGFTIDTNEIRKVVGDEVVIIRDAAEAFPSESGQLNVGEENIVTTSFYANKIITSGEGGAIWGSHNLVNQISILKNQALASPGTFRHTSVGYNYRISNLHAAVFNGQWSRREEIMTERKRVFNYYSNAFSNLKSVISHNGDKSPWLFTMQLSPRNSVAWIRDQLFKAGIETRPGFTCFSEQKFLESLIRVSNAQSNALSLQESLISLPTNPRLSESKMNRIVGSIIALLN